MMTTYHVEYTDTLCGEANYCWVKRGKLIMPELTHYGYDVSTNYAKENKVYERELMKRAKALVGITGLRGVKHDLGDVIEFRPYSMNTIMFITCE